MVVGSGGEVMLLVSRVVVPKVACRVWLPEKNRGENSSKCSVGGLSMLCEFGGLSGMGTSSST
jgi:hypothetical protein